MMTSTVRPISPAPSGPGPNDFPPNPGRPVKPHASGHGGAPSNPYPGLDRLICKHGMKYSCHQCEEAKP
jgi:hypothetical protein